MPLPFTALSTPLRRFTSLLGLTATDPTLVAAFDDVAITPPEEADDTVTTDENQQEFRFEGGVLVELWINPGSELKLPEGLEWDQSPDEVKLLLGPPTPLGRDKSKPDAWQWTLAADERARLYVHMNVHGGFSLRGEVV